MKYRGGNPGIYCFENLVNGKKYVGQSKDVVRRLREHEIRLLKGIDKSINLQRAINKYGIDNFCVYVLETCCIEDLNDREIFWISKLHTNEGEYGYNISLGGDRSLTGYNHSEETKRKLSEMRKGSHLSEEHKKKISLGNVGKHIISEEDRKKMSERQMGEKHHLWGKHHREDSRRKMSESRRGNKAYQFGKKKANASSQYYGVRRLIQKGFIYWQASIKIYQQEYYIGMSKDEIEAAKLYDAYVIEHNLPNPLNFPEGVGNELN